MAFSVLTLQSPKANITVNNGRIVAARYNSFQRGEGYARACDTHAREHTRAMTEQLARLDLGNEDRKKRGKKEKQRERERVRERGGEKIGLETRASFAVSAERKERHPRVHPVYCSRAEPETCDRAILAVSLCINQSARGRQRPRWSTGGANRYNTSMAPRAHI